MGFEQHGLVNQAVRCMNELTASGEWEGGGRVNGIGYANTSEGALFAPFLLPCIH